MTRALLGRQLRHHAPLLAAILGGLVAFELFMVWIAHSVDMGPSFQEFLESILPPAMQKLVLNQFGLTSFPAAVAFGFKHPLVLISGVAFSIVVATIPAAERETGLLDLILARPVRRERYLGAHMLLLLPGAILIPLSLLAGAAAGLAITGRNAEVGWTSYVGPTAAFAPLLLLVGAYTMWFAVGARRRGTAIARAAGLTLVFFMYEVLASMWDRLSGYEWATIFTYYAPVSMVSGQQGARDPLILLALALALLAASAVRFSRQEL